MIAWCSKCRDMAIIVERDSGPYCTWCGSYATPSGIQRKAKRGGGVRDNSGRPEAALKLRDQGKTWREVCAETGYRSETTAIKAVHRLRIRLDEAA